MATREWEMGLTKQEIFEIVREHIVEVLGDVDPADISPEKSMVELGANSVDRLEVTTLSMATLGLQIPLMSFAKVNDIGGLIDVLTEHALKG